jgi:hypothetical protein
MPKQTRQEQRDEKAYKDRLNAQIGFYKPTCLLGGGVYHGHCEGPLKVYSPQGHGLCLRHQEVVRKKGRVALGGSEFFIEVAPEKVDG